ncbi:MAG: ribonuclease P protein component [Candidatus Omnitrophota bacterium]
MLKLKKYSEFQKVYKKGKVFKEENIRLYLLPNGMAHNRLGISISSRKAPLSVSRNRSRRLLTESYRKAEGHIKEGYDMILLAERDLSKIKFTVVERGLRGAFKKSNMII